VALNEFLERLEREHPDRMEWFSDVQVSLVTIHDSEISNEMAAETVRRLAQDSERELRAEVMVPPRRESQVLLPHFDRVALGAPVDALDRFAVDEFSSPFRSTVPLLSMLLHDSRAMGELVSALGLEPSKTTVHLEYRVEPRAVRGPASQTDMMLISGDRAVAVEAKWTEPEYDDVATWLRRGGENRAAVLGGWLDCLRPYSSGALMAADVGKVTYQAVHRAASACATAASPALTYVVFTPAPDGRESVDGHLRGAMRRLAAAIGDPEGLPLYLVRIDATPTAAFEALRFLPKGASETAVAVQTALRVGALFRFGSPRVERIREEPNSGMI
jgi:hypothetical protein